MSIILENRKLNGSVVDKEELILKFCRGKTVLHLGCADYPYSIEQHNSGKLLHEKIHKVAQRTFGLDISQEGIAFLKSLCYEDVFVGNVERLGEVKAKGQYDVIIAGELIEHLSNVGGFYENIIEIMNDNTILIITVPNAHSIKGFVRVLTGRELIHPEHVCYFSPATIEHLSKRYNCNLMEYFYYLLEPDSILKKVVFTPIKYFIKFICPYISEGLIFVLKKKGKT